MSTSEPYPGCGGIQPNSDIAGIGVRVAFYLQAIAAAVQSVQSSDDDSASWYSAVLTSAGLVITAFIFAQQGQLDLYHAILVTLLASLQLVVQETIEFGRMVRLHSARHIDNSTGFSRLMGDLIKNCLVLTFYLWVWIDVTEFGSQPECNQYVNFSLVVTTINVTNRGLRIFVLFASSFVGLAVLQSIFDGFSEGWWLCFLFKLLSFVCFTAGKRVYCRNIYKALYIRCRLQAIGERFESEQIKPRNRPQGAIDLLAAMVVPPPVSKREQIKEGIRFALQSIYVLWLIIVYFICMTERTIAVNANLVLPGEDGWQFGQVLALLLAAVPMVSILSWTSSSALHEQLKSQLRLRILHVRDVSLGQPDNRSEEFCLVLLVSVGDKDYGSIQIPCAAGHLDVPSSWLDLPVDERSIISFSMYCVALGTGSRSPIGSALHRLQRTPQTTINSTHRTGWVAVLDQTLQRIAKLYHAPRSEMNLFQAQFWTAPAQQLGTTFMWIHSCYPLYKEEEAVFRAPLTSVSPSSSGVSPLNLMFSLKCCPSSGSNIRGSTLQAEAGRSDVILRNTSHGDPIPQRLTITCNDAIRIGRKRYTLSRMGQGEATWTSGSRAQPNVSYSHRPVTPSTTRTSWREMTVRAVERFALSRYPILQQLIPIRLRESETSSYEHSSHYRIDYDIAFLAVIHAEIVLLPLASRDGTDTHNVQFLIRCWGPTRLNGSLIRTSTDEQTFYFPLDDDSIIELWDIRYAEQSLPEGNDDQRLALRFNFTVPIDAQV